MSGCRFSCQVKLIWANTAVHFWTTKRATNLTLIPWLPYTHKGLLQESCHVIKVRGLFSPTLCSYNWLICQFCSTSWHFLHNKLCLLLMNLSGTEVNDNPCESLGRTHSGMKKLHLGSSGSNIAADDESSTTDENTAMSHTRDVTEKISALMEQRQVFWAPYHPWQNEQPHWRQYQKDYGNWFTHLRWRSLLRLLGTQDHWKPSLSKPRIVKTEIEGAKYGWSDFKKARRVNTQSNSLWSGSQTCLDLKTGDLLKLTERIRHLAQQRESTRDPSSSSLTPPVT